MTRSILAAATLLLTIGATPQAFAQYGGYEGGDDRDSVVRCESTDGRQRFCQADTRGGVRLIRQLSNSACIEGQTWGSDRRGLWVDRGCRGEFLLQRDDWNGGYPGYPGNGYPGQGDTFRCESRDGRWQRCPSSGRRVELVRQLSDRPCIRGRTWDTDGQGVWVSGGCRAEFRTRGGGGGGWGNAQPQVVRCESGDGRRRMCSVTIRGDARLVRQMSKSPCVEGDTWGFSRDGVWVDRGCRGEFVVDQSRGRRDGD